MIKLRRLGIPATAIEVDGCETHDPIQCLDEVKFIIY